MEETGKRRRRRRRGMAARDPLQDLLLPLPLPLSLPMPPPLSLPLKLSRYWEEGSVQVVTVARIPRRPRSIVGPVEDSKGGIGDGSCHPGSPGIDIDADTDTDPRAVPTQRVR